MAYFSEGETVYINSAVFALDHQGIVISTPYGDETFYDVFITESDDQGHMCTMMPFTEDELTKFTNE